MADKRIGELPVAEALESESLLVVEQQNEARSIRGELVADFARGAVRAYVQTAQDAAQDAGIARSAAESAAAQAEQTLADKQDKLRGAAGQVVGFDGDGNAVAQPAPAGGITMDAADRRYLMLSGGMLTGPLMMVSSAMFLNGASLSGNLTLQSAYGGESVLVMAESEPGGPAAVHLLATGAVALRGVAAPEEDTDAANKAYVDGSRPIWRTVILTKGGWSGSGAVTQTAAVAGAAAAGIAQAVQVVPDAASQTACHSAEVLCTGREEGTLTFSAAQAPQSDLTVYVALWPV